MSTPLTAQHTSSRNSLAALWGATGIAGICAFAVWRLAAYAAEALAMPLSWMEWALLIGNTVFMAWSEGYRGFQQRFAPRVAARALYLYRTPVPLTTQLAAPLFCFGYFGASRRTRRIAWLGTVGIVVLVLLVNRLSQPWRGIIDAGVVVGLSWGVASLLVCYVRAFLTGSYPASPDVEDITGPDTDRAN